MPLPTEFTLSESRRSNTNIPSLSILFIFYIHDTPSLGTYPFFNPMVFLFLPIDVWLFIELTFDFSSFASYDVGVLSGCLLMEDFQNRFINDQISKTLLVSVLMAGAFVGALYSGPLADYIGRKRSIIFGTAVNILGSVIQTAATDTDMMIVGRVIGGLSIG
jgi:MFS family permease